MRRINKLKIDFFSLTWEHLVPRGVQICPLGQWTFSSVTFYQENLCVKAVRVKCCTNYFLHHCYIWRHVTKIKYQLWKNVNFYLLGLHFYHERIIKRRAIFSHFYGCRENRIRWKRRGSRVKKVKDHRCTRVYNNNKFW